MGGVCVCVSRVSIMCLSSQWWSHRTKSLCIKAVAVIRNVTQVIKWSLLHICVISPLITSEHRRLHTKLVTEPGITEPPDIITLWKLSNFIWGPISILTEQKCDVNFYSTWVEDTKRGCWGNVKAVAPLYCIIQHVSISVLWNVQRQYFLLASIHCCFCPFMGFIDNNRNVEYDQPGPLNQYILLDLPFQCIRIGWELVNRSWWNVKQSDTELNSEELWTKRPVGSCPPSPSSLFYKKYDIFNAWSNLISRL